MGGDAAADGVPRSPGGAAVKGKRAVRHPRARAPRTRFGRWLQDLRVSRKLAVVIAVQLLHATILLALRSPWQPTLDSKKEPRASLLSHDQVRSG